MTGVREQTDMLAELCGFKVRRLYTPGEPEVTLQREGENDIYFKSPHTAFAFLQGYNLCMTDSKKEVEG